MPLSANLFKLDSSILPRANRATNRNNVATEKLIQNKKILAPDSPVAETSGAEMSSTETAAPNRRRRYVPDPFPTDQVIDIIHRLSTDVMDMTASILLKTTDSVARNLIIYYYIIYNKYIIYYQAIYYILS